MSTCWGRPTRCRSRSYVDDYFVVVTPAAELPINEIQHAYLHYLLDPLLLQVLGTFLKQERRVGDYALGAPALEPQYKNDFILLATECLIKAVESRMERKPALVDQALREGFVLTPAFAEQLAVYEKQEQAMRLYLPELVRGIDLKREEARLDHIDFASSAFKRHGAHGNQGSSQTADAARRRHSTKPRKPISGSRSEARARTPISGVLQGTDQKPIHAKAYYGLARIAVLDRDPELGDRLFRKVLELEPDADQSRGVCCIWGGWPIRREIAKRPKSSIRPRSPWKARRIRSGRRRRRA